jgi:hypothetical protein
MLYEDFGICFAEIKEADYTEGVIDNRCVGGAGADAE